MRADIIRPRELQPNVKDCPKRKILSEQPFVSITFTFQWRTDAIDLKSLSARLFPSAAGNHDRGKRQHAEAVDQQRHVEKRLTEERRVKLIQHEKRQRDQRKNDANMRKKFF